MIEVHPELDDARLLSLFEKGIHGQWGEDAIAWGDAARIPPGDGEGEGRAPLGPGRAVGVRLRDLPAAVAGSGLAGPVGGPGAGGVLVEPLGEVEPLEHELDGGAQGGGRLAARQPHHRRSQ